MSVSLNVARLHQSQKRMLAQEIQLGMPDQFTMRIAAQMPLAFNLVKCFLKWVQHYKDDATDRQQLESV